MALLCDAVVAQGRGGLREFVEELWLLQLRSCLEGYLDVAASECQVVPLLDVLLEEERDLAVALLLEVADDRASAKLTTAQNFSDLCQILLLEGPLEQVVGVINFVYLHLAERVSA